MSSIIIIPARMGSSRFPGKPLYKIEGIEMINRVVDACTSSQIASQVIVATCDKEIKDCVEGFGGKVVMTSDTHERASDRVAEAVSILEESDNVRYTTIIMVQGDEPLVNPADIDLSIRELEKDKSVDICNIMCHIDSYQEFKSKNVVKVVTDINNFALCMSRSPIPYVEKSKYRSQGYKQTGVIGFSRESLNIFDELPETNLERLESIDMMRVLQHGKRIKMVLSSSNYIAVDVIEDVLKVTQVLKSIK
jgi:3-deoxy-manno-octulosonate cytidylyltransferase (CMP-KDO synthetase)